MSSKEEQAHEKHAPLGLEVHKQYYQKITNDTNAAIRRAKIKYISSKLTENGTDSRQFHQLGHSLLAGKPEVKDEEEEAINFRHVFRRENTEN